MFDPRKNIKLIPDGSIIAGGLGSTNEKPNIPGILSGEAILAMPKLGKSVELDGLYRSVIELLPEGSHVSFFRHHTRGNSGLTAGNGTILGYTKKDGVNIVIDSSQGPIEISLNPRNYCSGALKNVHLVVNTAERKVGIEGLSSISSDQFEKLWIRLRT
jgi:hypothetical protein